MTAHHQIHSQQQCCWRQCPQNVRLGAIVTALVVGALVAMPACSQDPEQGNSTKPEVRSSFTLSSDTIALVDTAKVKVDVGDGADTLATKQSDSGVETTDVPKLDTNVAAATPDAGTPDAATPDAGTTDAGTTDAGTPDAGTPDTYVAPPVPVVRFVAIGDTGTASKKQYQVGKVLADHCNKVGCDFVLLLGDNFYDVGVKDANDQQFVDKFEKPYKDVKAPFYVVLGNHDYGAGGAGADFMKKEHYLKYAKKNPQWVMPGAYWDKVVKHVHLFALDSNSMLYGDVLKFIVADQLKDMDKAIAASKAQWKISFSHHPMRSNGPHGNAGCYEGAKTALIPALCGLIPLASGQGVFDSFKKLVCGRMDVHFAGHDHSRQWLKKSVSTKFCKGVELIVSGGGAKTTSVATMTKGGFEFNPVHFQDATTPGFFYAEIKGDTFTGYFIDMNGKKSATRTFKQGK